MKLIVYTEEQLQQVVDDYRAFPAFAIDVETRGEDALDPLSNEVFWVALAGPGRADVIPIGHPLGVKLKAAWVEDQPYEDYEDLTPKTGKPRKKWRKVPHEAIFTSPPPHLRWPGEVFSTLKPLLFSDQIKIGHNIQFDMKSIAKYYDGQLPEGPYHDTMVLQHIVNENLPSKALGNLVKNYFGVEWKGIGKNPNEHGFFEVARYARWDAKYTWLLWRRLLYFIRVMKLNQVLDLDAKMSRILAEAELRGITIDRDQLDHVDHELTAKIEETKADLYRVVGREWNPNSNAECATYVYGHLGHRATKLTNTGQPSVDKYALEAIASKDPNVQRLLDYKELTKLKNTYVDGLRERLRAGRIHTNFRLATVKTGRLSSSNPNLQNIPRPGSEMSTLLRGLFVPRPGYLLVVADYSQIEYRVLAGISGDETYKQMFLSGVDAHVATAATLFNIDFEEVDKTQRTVAKNTGFAVVYGAGPEQVAKMSGVNLLQAKEVMRMHQRTFRRVYEWKSEEIQKARRRKRPYMATLMGRRRRLPDLHSSDDYLRGRAERQGINHIIQGTAAEVMKMACVALSRNLEPGMHFLLTVHDEVVVECPEPLAERCAEIVKASMTAPEIQSLFDVPIEAEPVIVDRWSDAK